MKLRPYQEEALAAVEDKLGEGLQRAAVGLPTGTGKTVLFGHWITQDDQPALVLAHRDELLDQAADKLRAIRPDVWVGKVKAEHNDVHHPIVVASVQTISRPARMRQLPRDYRRVVVDEAHHATAPSYRYVLDQLGAYADDGPAVLGVSATFERADRSNLGDVWQEVVYHRDLLWAISQGYLVELRGLRARLQGADLGRLRVVRGDFVDSEAAALLSEAGAPSHAVDTYHQHAQGRKAIVFTGTVALAQEFAAAFTASGVPSWCLHGATPADERAEGLAAFARGDYMVTCNCGVLTEGYDESSVDAIFVARPTRSRVLYIQMVGRGTRLHPGKPDCLVVDMVGVSDRLDLLTIPRLFGLADDAMDDGQTLQQAVQQAAIRSLGGGPVDALQAQLLVQAVELFRQRATIEWARVPGGAAQFTVSVGDEGLVTMAQDGDSWQVWHVPRDRAAEWVLLGTAPDLAYAQGTAEDAIRRLGGSQLARPDAAWRSRPATDKQRQALRRWRLHNEAADPKLTAGQAAQLMTAAIAAAEFKRRRVPA